MCFDGCYNMFFSMVTLREIPDGSTGVGEGSSSCFGAGQCGDRIREFISAEIMCSIIDQTPVIFGSIKEGILELLDSRLKAFRAEIATE